MSSLIISCSMELKRLTECYRALLCAQYGHYDRPIASQAFMSPLPSSLRQSKFSLQGLPYWRLATVFACLEKCASGGKSLRGACVTRSDLTSPSKEGYAKLIEKTGTSQAILREKKIKHWIHRNKQSATTMKGLWGKPLEG